MNEETVVEDIDKDLDDDLLKQADDKTQVDDKTKVDDKADKPDELKQALADLTEQVTKATAPKPEPEKELSQDEKDELWAVWKPEKSDPDFFRKFLRLQTDLTPDQVNVAVKEFQPVFDAMRNGLVKQAVVGARNLATMEFEKVGDRIKPLEDYISSKRAEETSTRFYNSYEGLKDPKFEKIVNATAKLLDNKTFDNETDYFKALAEGAAETIQAVLPDFVLGDGKTKTTKTAATTPRLNRTSVGGQGGAGSGGGQDNTSASKDHAASVLD